MYNLYNISVIKSLLSENDLRVTKGLGQNFLIDRNVCRKIVSCSGFGVEDGVIEIGAGLGTLTSELALEYRKVVAIEVDSRLIRVLHKTLRSFDNIKIINDDALKIDFNKLISEEFIQCKRIVICANLPFYITTPIVMHILENNNYLDGRLESMTLMVQKEAAQRMTVLPGSRMCGAVTFAINFFSSPRRMFDVSKNCFFPAPNVDSSVIKLDLYGGKWFLVKDREFFFNIVRAAFFQRRKNLANSLSQWLKLEKKKVSETLESIMISSCARPESLSFEDFSKISNTFFDIIF